MMLVYIYICLNGEANSKLSKMTIPVIDIAKALRVMIHMYFIAMA